MITDLRAADWSNPAVVLKFDQNMLHQGSLGVIRSLGRLGVPVYGVHEGAWAPPRVPATWPAASSGSPVPMIRNGPSGLLDLASRIGRRAVLYATDDAGAIFLAEHGDALREAFAFPRPPLTGQPAEAGEMTRGRRFLVENYDPLAAVGYWRRGELGLRSWVRSLWRVDEVAWLARDDLRPFGLMCARMAWRAVSRGVHRRSPTRGPSAPLRATGGPRYRPGPRATCARPVRPEPDAEFRKEGERV